MGETPNIIDKKNIPSGVEKGERNRLFFSIFHLR